MGPCLEVRLTQRQLGRSWDGSTAHLRAGRLQEFGGDLLRLGADAPHRIPARQNGVFPSSQSSPLFCIEKVWRIVGVWVNPPEWAAVLRQREGAVTGPHAALTAALPRLRQSAHSHSQRHDHGLRSAGRGHRQGADELCEVPPAPAVPDPPVPDRQEGAGRFFVRLIADNYATHKQAKVKAMAGDPTEMKLGPPVSKCSASSVCWTGKGNTN